MKLSIKRKFTIIGAGMIVGFILINIILTYLFMTPFTIMLSTKQLNNIAIQLENRNMHEEEDFQNYIDQLEEDMGTRITIIDGEGKVLFSTANNLKSKDKISEDSPSGRMFYENRADLDAGKSVSASRENDSTNSERIRIFLVRKVGADRYAFVSRSYRSFQNSMRAAILFELVSGGVLLILGLIIVQRWSYYFVTPIEQITEAAEHISNLEFDTKVEVTTKDELGQLSAAINRMSNHLEANVEQLQEDIENRKKLVRNLSHEIKSPVAVIMGYSDRMKKVMADNPDKAKKYCEIISDESSRIDILVKEMLEFSKLEQEHGEPNKEKFEAARLFGDLKKRFYQENVETKITYEDSFVPDEYINADYIMMERAVYNLIRNAVTYVAGEAPLIKVSGTNTDGYYVVSVYNSGSSIPDDDRLTIWEPFGKVDKVRGRSKKGYGLGLSIVREIVEKHEGRYRVDNLDDGVSFVISFKQ